MNKDFRDAVRSHIFMDGVVDFARRARYRVESILGKQLPSDIHQVLDELEATYNAAYELLENHGLIPE